MSISISMAISMVIVSWLGISLPLSIVTMVSISTIHGHNRDDSILAQHQLLSCHSNRGVHSHHNHENIHDDNIQGQPRPPSCHSNRDGHIHHKSVRNHDDNTRAQHQPPSCHNIHGGRIHDHNHESNRDDNIQ